MSETQTYWELDEVKTALFQIKLRIVRCLKDVDEYNDGELETIDIKQLLKDIVDILNKNIG